MGLDNYASRSPDRIDLAEEDERAFEGVELCGGLMSGEGGSFRGKVYLDVVERVADAYLGQEWIPPEAVREIADAFERCDPVCVADESKDDHHPATMAEVEHLRAFFRICAERGLGLIGSW